ncbi:CYTH domain-containing protein [Bacillus safensis]|uniref:CYTH domain-containing protein n=1 Tax=Bacillus safensis TaxID=561879 RepID=UPI000F05E941|nr:CYTH domain-containing protein [Bacillus safensis]MED4592680.1 CYTH domain-containing protein [Bacillus safensis]MED4638505.1 CYTH domain-containing protein [Bacillus safensis]VCT96200.1 Putative triphosphatase YjbK [Bacillus safensis]
MAQEIEIELKQLLMKEEFEQLKQHFQLKDADFHTQTNYYFDTPQFDIKSQLAALRMREKNGQWVLTLKEPHEIGLLETHQKIAPPSQLEDFKLPDGEVADRLDHLNIQKDQIVYFGSLETSRAEKMIQEGLIVLDHSRYLTVEDYELEFEVSDLEIGQADFSALLRKFHIPVRNTKNKVVRFYEEKMKTQNR